MDETASEMPENGERQPDSAPDRIAFHYIKSSAFRVAHVDGVVGGLTPRGDISMSLWSERLPIPKTMVFAITNGQLGDEFKSEREGRSGVVREVECCATFDLATAKLIRDWLDRRIAQCEDFSRASLAEGLSPEELSPKRSG